MKQYMLIILVLAACSRPDQPQLPAKRSTPATRNTIESPAGGTTTRAQAMKLEPEPNTPPSIWTLTFTVGDNLFDCRGLTADTTELATLVAAKGLALVGDRHQYTITATIPDKPSAPPISVGLLIRQEENWSLQWSNDTPPVASCSSIKDPTSGPVAGLSIRRALPGSEKR